MSYSVFHKTLFLLCAAITLFVVSCKEDDLIGSGDYLPHFNIKTLGGVGVDSKENYLPATITIGGRQIYKIITLDAQIRGRGNSTWSNPKKPYRLKFNTATSIFGLKADKDWVLLANSLDGSHMLNPIAMKIGSLLEMPYTNQIVPTELTLNGKYQGLYAFTQQIEVDKDRINLGEGGLLLELDTNFDEKWKFESAKFNLPVMIHHPKITNPNQVEEIKAEFTKLENLIANEKFPNNNYLDFFDADAMANYFIVHLLTDNQEINHPKSTYFYKPKNGKFTMGPIWDFDWAYNYEQKNEYFSNPQQSLFWDSPSKGTFFFSRIMSDPKIKAIVINKWLEFRSRRFNELLIYVENYSNRIEEARNRDFGVWNRGNPNFREDVERIKKWLQERAIYIDNYLSNNFEKK
jgi:hypothetical protein